MNMKRITALLLAFVLIVPLQIFATDGDEGGGNDSGDTLVEWLPEDFTYDDVEIGGTSYKLYPMSNNSDVLTGTIHIVTGFSTEGEEKLALSTDLVIPAEDTEGNQVQGTGKDAFKNKGLTSVSFPEGVTTDNGGKWDPFVNVRGNFFIGDSSFKGNSLTELSLPEGVIWIGDGAFMSNGLTSVSFPSTVMAISRNAFGENSISDLYFTEETDFPLQIDSMAFYENQIKEVYLPDKTEKVTKWAFFHNTGMEPVVYGTEQEKKGGIVYLYIKDPGRWIEDTVTGKSNVQKMFAEYSAPPEEEDPEEEPETEAWTSSDFTYGEYEKRLYGCDYSRDFTISGIAVTGFSESGLQKLETNKDLVIPSKDTDGNTIVGVGPSAFYNKGLKSVTFPTGMLVNYNDTVTYRITKRGNFVIAESAFGKNEITSVNLPDGVIAVLGNAFKNNQLTEVTLPKTIWWVENMAFASNQISKVNFPETTYFQFEMHGWPFADNRIKSVRLPDFTAVVNKYVFQQNPGMEKLTDSELKQAYNTPMLAPTIDEQVQYLREHDQDGIVYMYTDAVEMADMDRIHHYDKSTASTHSYFQKLVINDGSPETQNPDGASWNTGDFTYSGTTVTGLSAAGKEKRKTNKNLVIPDYNSNAEMITEIASAPPQAGGLFATSDEKFDTVTLPSGLLKIGDNVFRESGISDVAFPPELEEIGLAAFQNNNLKSIVLPDTVTSLGEGAFATNKDLEKIILSSGLTEIPDGAFGCSDAKHWMKNLTEIEIPYGVTKIGSRAFAGSNFHEIVIPDGVTEIGAYAFSTKNYLMLSDNTECTLILPDSLEKLGDRAFRNKKIARVEIPAGLESLGKNTFEKVLSTYGTPDIPGSMVYQLTTQVFIRNKAQYEDRAHFPDSKFHDIHFIGFDAWEPEDFEYEDVTVNRAATIHVVKGFSASGLEKLELNKELGIPAEDGEGNKIEGIGDNAFSGKELTAVRIPEGLESIGNSALSGNTLVQIDIPEGITNIGDGAFGSNSISTVSFPDTIVRIGEGAFADNNISGIRFPETTTSPLEIYDNAFADNSIKAVQLPDGTGKVAGSAFARNKGRGGIVYMYVNNPGEDICNVEAGSSESQKLIPNENMPPEDRWQIDDFEYSADSSAITGFSEYGKERLAVTRKVVLPDQAPDGTEIIMIAKEAFAIDGSDTDVGKYDFNSINGITSVVLPQYLKTIGDRAFEYNNLAAIDFSRCKSIKKIGESAFHGNHLTQLSLPDTVTELGGGAFSANNIRQLKLSKGVTEIPQGAFSMNIRLSKVEIPDTVTEIGPMAFAGARLTSLKIPSSVIKIGRKAFHLHHLKSLTVPGNVKEIGDSAFEGTYKALSLKSLTLEEGIEHIGKYAFKEGLLTRVTLPKSLLTMGEEPFLNNTGEGSGHVVTLISYNPKQLAFNEGAKFHKVIDQASADAAAAKEKADAAAAKAKAEEAARAKAEAEAKAKAEARAKKIKTVTVNTGTVNAKAIDKAVTKAGGSSKYVTKIVLGNKVRKISKFAFRKYKKVTTIVVKSKKLKKSSVKGSLKKSKVKTVKVKLGTKKLNKKYIKKYKKIFTKKNAGRKVKVK